MDRIVMVSGSSGSGKSALVMQSGWKFVRPYICDIIKVYLMIVDFQNSGNGIQTFYDSGEGYIYAFSGSPGAVRSGVRKEISNRDHLTFF